MDLKNKATEKLNTELKGVKIITGTLISVLILLFIICIYGLIVKENNSTFISLMIIPFALSPIILLNLRSIQKIKKELELRK